MVDERHLELIHAEIDGEISEVERAELQRYLADNPEARTLREELYKVSESLDRVAELDPPAELRQAILDSVRLPKTAAIPRILRAVWPAPSTLRYAYAFSAGLIISAAVFQLTSWSRSSVDLAELAGTMTRHEPLPRSTAADTIRLDLEDITGSVHLHTTDSMLVIEFDLSSRQPVEVVAAYEGPEVRLGGFAQLENELSAVAAEPGRITLTNEGDNRYTVFLSNAHETTIDLKFFSSGALIHEDSLRSAEGRK